MVSVQSEYIMSADVSDEIQKNHVMTHFFTEHKSSLMCKPDHLESYSFCQTNGLIKKVAV